MSSAYRIMSHIVSRIVRSIILSVLVFSFILPSVATADGAVVSPPNYYVQETSQQAVVFYEAATQTETMVVGINYQGTAQDFGWLIPTPNQPTVERGSQNVFANLSAITDPYSNSYKSSEDSALLGGYDAQPTSSVTVVSEQQVAYYDVTVLTATNTEDLVNWFNANGYKYPQAYSYILQDYITNGWYFTAMKIDPTLVNTSSANSTLLTGEAVPVQLTFIAENMVYPLRISSIIEDPVAYDPYYDSGYDSVYDYPSIEPIEPIDSATTPAAEPSPASVAELAIVAEPNTNYNDSSYYSSYQNVTLYVVADHKVTSTNSALSLQYGNWVSNDEISAWALDTNGNPWVEPINETYYLTKLSGYLYDYQMTDDVFFTEAADNTVYTQDEIYAWDNDDYLEFGAIAVLVAMLVFAGFIISPFGIVHIIAAIIRGKAKGRGWKIAAHVVQWLNIITLKLVAALVVLLTWDDTIGDLPNLMNDYLYTEDAGGIVGLAVGVCLFELALLFATILQSIIMLVRRRRRAKKSIMATRTVSTVTKTPKRGNGQRKK